MPRRRQAIVKTTTSLQVLVPPWGGTALSEKPQRRAKKHDLPELCKPDKPDGYPVLFRHLDGAEMRVLPRTTFVIAQKQTPRVVAQISTLFASARICIGVNPSLRSGLRQLTMHLSVKLFNK